MLHKRLLRARVLEALDLRAKQFRSREEIFPFRVPHEPLSLDDLIDEALADTGGHVDPEELKSRTVLGLHWHDGAAWTGWAITLPSGIHMYCDTDGQETRVLATVKRGTTVEADGFFVELLAESRGHYFGIEMEGDAPDMVRTSIPDREFLIDMFVELFEGTPAQASIHAVQRADQDGHDFRADIAHWLDRVLITPPPPGPRRRVRRLRDQPLEG